MTIRRAVPTDVPSIHAIDPLAGAKQRRIFISNAVKRRTCYVAVVDSKIAGYCVLEYSFFERGFVSMLVVDARLRRMGIGSALLRHAEKRCLTPALFTSTNESNLGMRTVLRKSGYKRSGRIDNLDHNDPELIFVKVRKPNYTHETVTMEQVNSRPQTTRRKTSAGRRALKQTARLSGGAREFLTATKG